MKPRALIVDDSLTVRMDLNDAFEAAGFEAELCASLAEARAALVRRSFAVLILDLLLPDGEGLDLLAEVRQATATATLPILLLSSEAEVSNRVRGLKTGADEYVGKPYNAAFVVGRARELFARSATVEGTRATATVLVIDDSATLREELRAVLKSAEYDVLVAGSGEEGLRIAADRRPSAIIVDGVLPGIDGATVIRHVRLDAALRGVPCILMTGSEGQGDELRALDAGADAFVKKEEPLTVIVAKLAAVLRRVAGPGAGNVTKSALGPNKILAVDDSPTYLTALAEALRGDGYEVILAHSGEEALELLALQSVDCILLDVMMPGLSGQETCRRIKAAPVVRDVPVIMLTALEDRAAMVDGLSVGADDYITKSSEFEILKARVRAQIRRRHYEDENRRVREELLRKELETSQARTARDLALTRAALVEALERKNKELEAFSYSVSHDLRAPLRSIDGFSQALLEDCGDALDDRGKRHLHRVRAATQRMGELIDDLLELSRVSRAELSRTRVSISDLARAVIDELRRREPGRDVTAAVEEGLFASADSGLLRVVLENLLGNAWKFTSKTEHAKIELRSDVRADGTAYCVRDNGAGFSMTYAEKLFVPFQRLHKEADFPGTGIGLATVRRIIERHGGRVWVESAVGQGTTVFFALAPEAGAAQ